MGHIQNVFESDYFKAGERRQVQVNLEEIKNILKFEYKDSKLWTNDKILTPEYFHFAKIYYRESNATHSELNFKHDQV